MCTNIFFIKYNSNYPINQIIHKCLIIYSHLLFVSKKVYLINLMIRIIINFYLFFNCIDVKVSKANLQNKNTLKNVRMLLNTYFK